MAGVEKGISQVLSLSTGDFFSSHHPPFHSLKKAGVIHIVKDTEGDLWRKFSLVQDPASSQVLLSREG